MRKAIVVTLTSLSLALPGTQAIAQANVKPKPKKKVVSAIRSFSGVPGSADRWGDVKVTIVVRKTKTTILKTKKTTVHRRITKVRVPVYPDHTGRSVFINEQALPILVEETLRAQSTGIDLVSGATYTSFAFRDSLQSAILKARRW